ncbi:MAG: hypothetical protein IKT37_04170 [Clostridia bacterium]|nr:hypothetical protein [Clostridia bacterium]
MKETQKRIMEYSFKLPKLKEKVIAVALLLAVSASMLVTVSFAWLSISVNPAVQGVNTTIAANGNLEIALATGSASTITAPGESNVGDSNLAILERNLKWGNLVNLADASYGLSQMTLRPAKLNEFELATNPLYGPVYDEDGRVIDLNTNFGYSMWDTKTTVFEHTDKYGVRAITSMIYGTTGTATMYRTKINELNSKNGVLQGKYTALANNTNHMNALTDVMVGYMLHAFKTGGSSVAGLASESSFSRTQLQNFKALYVDFAVILAEQAQVYADFLNFQAEIEGKSISITAEEILSLSYGDNAAANAVKNMGFTAISGGFINELDQYLTDYNIVKEDIENIQGIIDAMSGSSVSWPNAKYTNSAGTEVSLGNIVDRFAVLSNCKIYLPNGNETLNVSSFTAASNVMKLTSEDDIYITINNGLLKNFENRNGARLTAKDIPLSMSAAGYKVNVKATVKTDASKNLFGAEVSNLSATITEKYGAPALVPSDTYGLAIDFWVRTNASAGYLTLQGNVLTTKEDVEVIGIDKNGNNVNIYTLSRELTQEVEGENGETTSETYTQSYDLYWLEEEITAEDGSTSKQTVWYNATTHSNFELQDGETPRQKIETVETVIGYEGDNRVWEGDQHAILSVNSTTQGSGSCYVYYANTPEDQARSLELLKYMKVAFIDAEGNLLAKAYMDTERHYAANGKVTVPMVLENDSINIGTNDEGESVFAITPLQKNTPMLITAIVYLDGDNLTNDYVLASSDIDGQLNIQFGNNQLLHPIDNETLYNAEMYISATVSPTEFSYDDGTEMKSSVAVTIEGYEPNTVEAFFVRAINAQTGAKEEKFVLNDADKDGVWTADYDFLYPGTYILRSVTIDGIERELTVSEGGSFPTVTVKGFDIRNVTYNINPNVFSVNNSYTGSVSLQFVTNDPAKMPKKVMGRFIREDGTTVNVNFVYDATTHVWTGNATFVSSGVYTMQYVVLDGEYTELDEGNRFTTDVKLGIKVNVTSDTVTNFVMTPDGNYPDKLDMTVVILDNNNNRITNVPDAELYYSLRGSSATTLYASLTWDADKHCFVGSLPTTSGIWSFSHVNIKQGDAVSTLSTANGDAPVFTIIAPDPPEDAKNNIATRYQYLADASGSYKQTNQSGSIVTTVDGAFASVDLKYASAAQVYAKLVPDSANESKTPVYVIGVASPVSQEQQTTRFTFAIPEGEWTITDIRVWDVYDKEQNPYLWQAEFGVSPIELTEEQYLTGMAIDVVDSTVAALYNVSVIVSHSGATTEKDGGADVIALGKNDGAISALFLEAQSITNNAITVKFFDQNGLLNKVDASGNPCFKISDVKLPYVYAYNSSDEATEKYGGYKTTSEKLAFTAKMTAGEAEFTNSASETSTFTMSSPLTLTYATKYTPGNLAFKITPSGQDAAAYGTQSKSTNALSIVVWSKKPYVKFTATNPAAGTTFVGLEGQSTVDRKNEIKDDGFDIVCYFQSTTTTCTRQTAANPSKATLGLIDVGTNWSSATCTLVSNGTGANVVYNFTSGNLYNEQELGSSSGSGNSLTLSGLGTKAKITTLIVNYNDIQYTIVLDKSVTATVTK